MIRALCNHSPEVADEIHRIFQLSYAQEAAILGIEYLPPLRRTRLEIQSAGSSFLGSWQRSKLAAVLEYKFEDQELCIDSLVVEPKFFRRGLASRLLETALNTLEWRIAKVETAAANGPAISLYSRFGFEIIREWCTPEGVNKIDLVKTGAP